MSLLRRRVPQIAALGGANRFPERIRNGTGPAPRSGTIGTTTEVRLNERAGGSLDPDLAVVAGVTLSYIRIHPSYINDTNNNHILVI